MFGFKQKSVHLTVIGDTHMRHPELGRMTGEVLIHVGDMFDLFSTQDDDFHRVDEWFAQQDFELILCIAGNHDFPIERRRQKGPPVFQNAAYLEDESLVFKGVTFYGSPWVPDLADHAFYGSEQKLQESWTKIPQDTDVLITHTPPAGILDRSSHAVALGCRHLATRIAEISPQVHCFGHVHASGGRKVRNGCLNINASSFFRDDQPLRRPVRTKVRART